MRLPPRNYHPWNSLLGRSVRPWVEPLGVWSLLERAIAGRFGRSQRRSPVIKGARSELRGQVATGTWILCTFHSVLPVLSGKPEVPETKLPEESDLERSWSRGRFYGSSRSRIPELVGCTSFGFLGAQLSREIIRLEVIDSADRAVIELIKPALLLLKLGDPRGPEWAIRSLGKVFEQIEVQTDSHSFDPASADQARYRT